MHETFNDFWDVKINRPPEYRSLLTIYVSLSVYYNYLL